MLRGLTSIIVNENMYIYAFPIPKGFRDRAVSLYSNLGLAPNIVLPSRT
jgi:hypothetical protein